MYTTNLIKANRKITIGFQLAFDEYKAGYAKEEEKSSGHLCICKIL